MSSFFSFITASTSTASNATSDAITVGWVADPTGRGTFSLVFSCLLTLGLCVWSAMHLNIPSQRDTTAQFMLRNVKWGLIGVVAPELVVFAAWRQYSSAKQLYQEVHEHLKEQEQVVGENNKGVSESKVHTKENEVWTMVHSFYAGMGGFTFEIDNSSKGAGSPFVPDNERLTISAKGVALLVRCGHLPKILESDIDDKSKADGLAKFLVCVQAAWMVVQVIGRVVLGLPVTLLEVNILGHVILAFVIYMLWWHKPRLVREPTRLEGDWIRPLCAYMYMSSQISGVSGHKVGLLRRKYIDPELSSLALCIPRIPGEQDEQSNEKARTDSMDPGNTASQLSIAPSSTSRTDYAASPTQSHLAPRPQPSSPAEAFALSDKEEQAMGQSSMQLTRWSLATEAVNNYPVVKVRCSKFLQSGDGKANCDWYEPSTDELITKCAKNWPTDDLLRSTGGLIMGMTLWLASMAYGGVHISAWFAYFPSTLEAWLWRSSAIYITWAGALWMMINLLAAVSKTINDYWDGVVALRAHWLSYLVIGSLCTICGIAYIFARLFLVVEAFISLRRLPIGAYATPDWTQLIPHF